MCSTSVFAQSIYLEYILVYLNSSNFMQMQQIVVFSYDSCCLFVKFIIFFISKLFIFIAWSLKDSQTFLMQSSPLFTSCLFLIPSDVHLVDIDYTQGIRSLTYVVDDFSKSFFHPSINLIKDLKSSEIKMVSYQIFVVD